MQGQVINGFVLKKLLGCGGMAEVWYAENEIGKSAAVKILNDNLSNNEQIVERFHNEALVMVKLDHPHIRQVYGYGYLGNRHCIVMEYLEGQDLEALLKQGRRFTDEELRRWWNQTVEALNYTHAMNIVHRDIKPSNLFLDKRGNIKLLDFGIAKVRESISMTRTGTLMGTLMYMSPEQVKDTKNIDYRTDVYSLAVTFIHLVSGITPYNSESTGDFEIREQIVYKPMDLSGLPKFWQTTLAPYLEKDPSKRPALQPVVELTPLDEAKTIVKGAQQKQEQATPVTVLNSGGEPAKRKPSVVPWIIAGAAACLAAAVIVYHCLFTPLDRTVNEHVNDGIQSTNMALSQELNQKYAAFEEQYAMNEEKVGPYWEQAQTLRAEADELINYAEALKWDLVKKVEDKTPYEALYIGLLRSADTVKMDGRKFYDINTRRLKYGSKSKPTVYMMGKPVGTGKAFELSQKIKCFRAQALKAVGPERMHEIGLITDSVFGPKEFVMEQTGLPESALKRLPFEGDYYGARMDYDYTTNDALKSSWEYDNFHNETLAGDITLLNKIVSEALTAELYAVTELMSDIHADFTYDEVSAKVFAESGYLLSGQTYRAQAMVTAWQNTQTLAYVRLDNGLEREYTSDGRGVINLDFNCGVGLHKYEGYIKMLDPASGELKDYPFENSFVVAPPVVSVSASKMNVVYRGIDNPIIVGGGVGGEVSATASSGTLTRTGNGIYILRPGEASEVTISVSSAGSSLGSMKFRVKDLPKPVGLIRNVVNGQVSKSALQAAGRVEAEIKDFDFDGVHYDVVGYTFIYKTKSGTTKEAKATHGGFTDEIRNAISLSNAGDMFIFTAIQVRGNDGKIKTLETPIGIMIK